MSLKEHIYFALFFFKLNNLIILIDHNIPDTLTLHKYSTNEKKSSFNCSMFFLYK